MTIGESSIAVGRGASRAVGRDPPVRIAPRAHFEGAGSLLAEVDFKWLMAGRGWHVELARLRSDASYAGHVLGLAMGSESPALRDAAIALSAQVEGARRGDPSDQLHGGLPA